MVVPGLVPLRPVFATFDLSGGQGPELTLREQILARIAALEAELEELRELVEELDD